MFHEQTPWLKKSWPALVIGGLVLLALLYSLLGEVGVVSTLNLYAKQKQLAAENNKLREENEQLRQEVEKLRSNASYIEEIARRELGLLGKKEIVIPLDRKKDAASPSLPAAKRDVHGAASRK
jgi:cell division protein FtsL